MHLDLLNHLKNTGVDFKLFRHSKNTSTCEESALERGVELHQTLKCMLASGADQQLIALLLRGDHKLKIKKVRNLLNQAVNLLQDHQIEKLNLQKGAISPLLLPPTCLIIMDQSVPELDWITFSAGQHDLGIGMTTEQLISMLNQPVVALIRSTSAV